MYVPASISEDVTGCFALGLLLAVDSQGSSRQSNEKRKDWIPNPGDNVSWRGHCNTADRVWLLRTLSDHGVVRREMMHRLPRCQEQLQPMNIRRKAALSGSGARDVFN